MIIQLDNELWQRIFLADPSLTREDVARDISMTWDNFNLVGRFCALGVFQLKPEKKDVGRFALVKSSYQKLYARRNRFKTHYFFSVAENHEEALLEFLPHLSQQEKKWLNAYQG